jgi:hypothetical protein
VELHESYANKVIETPYPLGTQTPNPTAGNSEPQQFHRIKTYEIKMPKILGKNVRYEEAFKKFSEAMASTDAEYNELKA